jgi:hypothetical protein
MTHVVNSPRRNTYAAAYCRGELMLLLGCAVQWQGSGAILAANNSLPSPLVSCRLLPALRWSLSSTARAAC